jgi:hypothetical protein
MIIWDDDTARAVRGATRNEDDGSLVAEYGLIAVLGATIAGLAIRWASGGAIFELLGSILDRVKGLVGV